MLNIEIITDICGELFTEGQLRFSAALVAAHLIVELIAPN